MELPPDAWASKFKIELLNGHSSNQLGIGISNRTVSGRVRVIRFAANPGAEPVLSPETGTPESQSDVPDCLHSDRNCTANSAKREDAIDCLIRLIVSR